MTVDDVPAGTRRTLLEYLEDRSDADPSAQSPSRLVCDVDLLVDQLIAKRVQLAVATNELQATERLVRLAMKHEDHRLAQRLSEDATYLRTVVPVYEERWSRYSAQWIRLLDTLKARSLEPNAKIA